jgi:hypothetical protein
MDVEAAQRFCERWLAAWTGGAARVDELLAYYSPDAFYADPARPGGVRGRDELRSHLHKLLEKYPSWRWEALEVFSTPRGFNLKWRVTLDQRCAHGLDIVEMGDGRITRNEVYFDPRAVFG